jgi:hypothetical protein
VNVDGGTYTNNGGYGLIVYPGPNGTLTFVNPATFGGNGVGDFNLDLTKSCVQVPDKPGLPYQVVEISGKGDDPATPDCEHFSGLTMILPDGTRVKVACPATDPVTVTTIAEEDLPGPLPKNLTLVEGLVVVSGEETGLLPDGGSVKMCFKIPDGTQKKFFSILFWDVLANEGLGAWIELPFHQFGNPVFELHPGSGDGMLILEGVHRNGDSVCARVNFTGTFVLAAR